MPATSCEIQHSTATTWVSLTPNQLSQHATCLHGQRGTGCGDARDCESPESPRGSWAGSTEEGRLRQASTTQRFHLSHPLAL